MANEEEEENKILELLRPRIAEAIVETIQDPASVIGSKAVEKFGQAREVVFTDPVKAIEFNTEGKMAVAEHVYGHISGKAATLVDTSALVQGGKKLEETAESLLGPDGMAKLEDARQKAKGAVSDVLDAAQIAAGCAVEAAANEVRSSLGIQENFSPSCSGLSKKKDDGKPLPP